LAQGSRLESSFAIEMSTIIGGTGYASYGTAMPTYGAAMPTYGAAYGATPMYGSYGGYGGAHPMDASVVEQQKTDATNVLTTHAQQHANLAMLNRNGVGFLFNVI